MVYCWVCERKKINIGEYLAKLQARTWLFRALSPSYSGDLANRTKFCYSGPNSVQPTKNWKISTQPDWTHGSTQPMDNSGPLACCQQVWRTVAGDAALLALVQRVQSTSDGRHRHCATATTQSRLVPRRHLHRLSTWSNTPLIGNESVPKIILNDRINLFL